MTRIPILMYHHIAPMQDGESKKIYVHPDAFNSQMNFLKQKGFQGLSMSDASPYLLKKAKGKVAVITFDDGYMDTLEVALPVLQQYGFTATCYAVSAIPQNYNTWDAREPSKCKPLMNHQQLRQWQENEMEIGAHTRTHTSLIHCNDNELHEQIHTCKKELENILEREINQFCYPYGKHDKRVMQSVYEAGYSDAVTVKQKLARPCREHDHKKRMRWPRIPVNYNYGLTRFAAGLYTGFTELF